MLVEALYFRENQLGFVLFEQGPRKGMIYDMLRDQLSNALQGTLLLGAREQAEMALQRAYAEVEQQIKDRTAELRQEVLDDAAGQRVAGAQAPAGESVDELREAVASVSELGDEPRGMLRLHVSTAADTVLAGPLLAEFLAQHPRVRLDVDVSDAPMDLVASGFDAGIQLGEVIDRDMVARLAVPTLEHYLPLLYVLGARDGADDVRFFADKVTLGSMSMRSVRIS